MPNPIFAQPTADANLTPGWDVQGNTGLGYGSVAGNSSANFGPGQAGAGFPNPAQAEDVGSENSASYSQSVLVNPGYADGTGHAQTQLGTGNLPAAPTLASATALVNPTQLIAQVTATPVGDVTAVSVKNVAGTVLNSTVGSTGVYTVPPGGSVTFTYTTAPTVTWLV